MDVIIIVSLKKGGNKMGKEDRNTAKKEVKLKGT